MHTHAPIERGSSEGTSALPPIRVERMEDALLLVVRADAPEDDLRPALEAALARPPEEDSTDLPRPRPTRVVLDLGSRPLDLLALRRLMTWLRQAHDLTVTDVRTQAESTRRFFETQLKVRVHHVLPEVEVEVEVEEELELDEDIVLEVEDPIEPPAPQSAPADTDPRRVLVVERTLRSGAAIRHTGDVLVYGDVNAGAEVVAGGNIVVLGALRGMAHAGVDGDETAMVLSFDLRPTQVRIAHRISEPVDRPRKEGPHPLLSLLQRGGAPAHRMPAPEIASIRDGRIVLEPYRGRLPSF